jgi:hypothetical protein
VAPITPVQYGKSSTEHYKYCKYCAVPTYRTEYGVRYVVRSTVCNKHAKPGCLQSPTQEQHDEQQVSRGRETTRPVLGLGPDQAPMIGPK